MMDESTKGSFQRILGLQADDEIPEEVQRTYEFFTRMNDIASGGPVSAKDQIFICLVSGIFDRPPAKVSENQNRN